MAHLQKELEAIRQSEASLRSRLRDIELDNDDLEKSERAISSTLSDVESRYNKAVERTALLEHELVDKARLEEELQRTKDELRENIEELAIVKSQHDVLLAAKQGDLQDLPQAIPADLYEVRQGRRGGQHSLMQETNLQRPPKGLHPLPDIDNPEDGGHILVNRSIPESESEPTPAAAPPAEAPHYAAARTPNRILSIPASTNALSNRHSDQPSNPSLSFEKRRSTFSDSLSNNTNTVREERSKGLIQDMRDLTNRMQYMSKNLTFRRESLMAGSAIPRASPRKSEVLLTGMPPLPPTLPASNSVGSMSESKGVKRSLHVFSSPSTSLLSNSAKSTSPTTTNIPIRSTSRADTRTRNSIVEPSASLKGTLNNPRPLSRLSTSSQSKEARPLTPSHGPLQRYPNERKMTPFRRVSMGPGGASTGREPAVLDKAANSVATMKPLSSLQRSHSQRLDSNSSGSPSLAKARTPVWR